MQAVPSGELSKLISQHIIEYWKTKGVTAKYDQQFSRIMNFKTDLKIVKQNKTYEFPKLSVDFTLNTKIVLYNMDAFNGGDDVGITGNCPLVNMFGAFKNPNNQNKTMKQLCDQEYGTKVILKKWKKADQKAKFQVLPDNSETRPSINYDFHIGIMMEGANNEKYYAMVQLNGRSMWP